MNGRPTEDGVQRRTPLPQFFFNFRDEAGLERDREGLDLPDLDAAYMEAFEAAKEMWIEAIRNMRNPMRQSFEIVDADDHVLIVVPFGEVMASLKGVPNQHPMETAHRAAKLTAEVRQAVATAHERLSEATSLLAQLPVR